MDLNNECNESIRTVLRWYRKKKKKRLNVDNRTRGISFTAVPKRDRIYGGWGYRGSGYRHRNCGVGAAKKTKLTRFLSLRSVSKKIRDIVSPRSRTFYVLPIRHGRGVAAQFVAVTFNVVPPYRPCFRSDTYSPQSVPRATTMSDRRLIAALVSFAVSLALVAEIAAKIHTLSINVSNCPHGR